MHLISHLKTKAVIILTIIAISLAGYAQAPNLINYQGVARNAVGNPLPNQTINLRLSLHNLSASGTVVYTETRPITTNLGGLFSVQIGSTGASSTTGSIAGVNWLTGDKYLQVEIDPTSNNNYLNMGTVQLISVPYAFNAATAGNALTVTTNANLTGVVTSTGNATAIANGAITNAMLANGALANLSGTNTGDNSVNTLYSGLLTNATHTGDATGSNALTVVKINGTLMSGLATGILKNTTATGIPSIAVASDFPTLNQNTSGTATNVTGTVAVANGGSGSNSLTGYIIGNGTSPFSTISKIPVTDISGTVAVANGGSGSTSLTGYIRGNGTSPFSTISKIPVTDVTAAVQKVNGNTPDANGNVTLAFGNVTSGTTASRPLNAGSNGNIYVISGDAIAADNGRTYISDGVAWQEVTSNQAATDQRYVKLSGSTMVGDLTFPTGTKASMTDAPIASTDLVNKSYVDTKVAGNILGNAVNVTGTVAVANGGSGSTSLTGYIIGNGTSPFSTISKIPVTDVTGTVAVANGGSGSTSLTGYIIGNGTSPFSTISKIPVTDVTGTVAVANGGSGSTSLTGYIIGNGTSPFSTISKIPVTDVTGAVQKVNGSLPGSDGNVTIAFGNVTTGNFALRPLNAGTNGNIYVISGDIVNKSDNGRTFISDGTGWQEVTSNQAATDARYVQLAAAGVSAVGSIGESSNVNGATISGSTITLTPADDTNGGIVTIGDQIFSGAKIFNSDLIINGLSIGRGGGNIESNTANGLSALFANTTGKDNTATGESALSSNTDGSYNTASGKDALRDNTNGYDNTANGGWALRANTTGDENTATGSEALSDNTTGSYNTAYGYQAGKENEEGDYNTFIGYGTGVDLDGESDVSNSTAIGNGANVENDNTIQLGNGDVTSVRTYGKIIANGAELNDKVFVTSKSYYNSQFSSSAVLEVSSETQGFLPPRMNIAERNAIASPAAGLMIWCNNNFGGEIEVFNGSNWVNMNGFSNPTLSNLTTVGTITTGVWSGTTIAIANGGTGATTKTTAFNALSPMTSSGDIIYGGASGTGTRLAKGTDAQVLTLVGGLPTWAAATAGVSSVGPIEIFANSNGATISGSTITLTPANASHGGIVNIHTQTFAGAKTFNSDLKVNSLTIGRGGGGNEENVSNGVGALYSNTTGGVYNTATGAWALQNNTTGDNNTANGTNALRNNLTGEANTATGSDALLNTTGSNNTAIGYNAGNTLTTGSNNTFLGNGANVASGALTNATAIGNGAIVAADNTIQLGNTSVTNVITSGTIKAGTVTYPSTHGTSGQVLSTTGSGTLTWTTAAAGVSSVGSISVSSNVKGATISGSAITLTPADATNGGIVTTGVQTFAGAKTFSSTVSANTLGVGISSPAASAVLEASSTTQGFLPPRMSKAERNAIASPVAGLMIWCTDNFGGEIEVYNGSIWLNMNGLSNSTLSIGDYYQGGKIAYILGPGDLGYDATTQHGSIAAISDQSTGIRWYNGSNILTNAIEDGIGNGLANTNKIITVQGGTPITSAAGLARAYTGGGYTDWYLPSKDELNRLYLNRNTIGGFTNSLYWSSTEYDISYAWCQDFASTATPPTVKSTLKCVRAIRAF